MKLLIGWLIGVAVAAVLGLIVAHVFTLTNNEGTVIGTTLGVFCPVVGMVLAEFKGSK